MTNKTKALLGGLPSRTLFNAGAMVIGGLIFSAAVASADGFNDTQTVIGTNMIIPYDGYLMVDNSPLTGVRTLKFDLYQDATGGMSVWNETQTVNLYNGKFSAGLGTGSSLNAVVLDAEKLYLGITVVETDANGNQVEIELSGRQSIEAAPYAAWSANAADLNVAGDLTVEGDTIKLGSNGANALVNNSSDELYISPGKGHTGGVHVGNDLATNYDTRLGPTDGSGSTRIYGPDSNGSGTAALRILKSNGEVMHLDSNEIDSSNVLHLQQNTNNDITLNGDTYIYKHPLIFQDANNANYTLTGVDDTYDSTGIELRTDTNPSSGEPLFAVMSSGGSERLRVEHDGVVSTTNGFTADGDGDFGGGLTVDGNVTLGDDAADTVTVKGDLTVEGKLNGWLEGNYCIVQSTTTGCTATNNCASNGNNCPSGFIAATAAWDTDDNDAVNSSITATTNVTVGGANGVRIHFCCK